jgi:membrane protease YdiL (CAAX protease family)
VYLRWVLTGLAFLLTLPVIIRVWWKTNRGREQDQSLVWAITLSWTLVLNLYLGIYDTSIVVLSVLLTTNAFYREANNHQYELTPTYKVILLLLYLAPWVTQPIAKLTGIQPFTLVLAWLGCYQLVYLRNSSESSKVKEALPMVSVDA